MAKKKRRSPSSGSIYKRKDGSWVASLRHLGKRHERRAASKAEAGIKLVDLRKLVMLDVDPSRMLVSELIERYLKHIAVHNEESTHDSYESALQHAAPLFNRSLTEVNPLCVSAAIDAIELTQTRRQCFKILKACFSMAQMWRILPQDEHPMFGLATPVHNSAKPNPLEYEEVQRLYAAAVNCRYRGAIKLAMMLGPRPSECWGFQWKDWDGENKLKLVRQAAQSRGKIIVKPPKTKAGVRTLLLPDALIAVLHDRRKEALAEGTAGSKWIWPGLRGEVTRRNNFGHRVWKNLLQSANIEHRGFHQCRHTAATTMLNNGVAIKLVSKILGHAKVSLTLDIYNGLMTEDQNQAVEFWNRRLG